MDINSWIDADTSPRTNSSSQLLKIRTPVVARMQRKHFWRPCKTDLRRRTTSKRRAQFSINSWSRSDKFSASSRIVLNSTSDSSISSTTTCIHANSELSFSIVRGSVAWETAMGHHLANVQSVFGISSIHLANWSKIGTPHTILLWMTP